MAVTIATARTYVNDVPRVFPPPVNTPDVIGQTDSVSTVFFLRFPNIIPATVQIFSGALNPGGTPPNIIWTGISSSAYTIGGTSTPETTGPTQSLITFNTAPTPSGHSIGSRYQATMFSDADLNNIIIQANNTYGSLGDMGVLAGIQYIVVGIILMNIDLLKLARYSEMETNPGEVIKGLVELRKQLKTDLENGGGPIAGKNVPILKLGGAGQSGLSNGQVWEQPYQPIW